MKINKNMLSIPPYITTTWDNITCVQACVVQDEFVDIKICLADGEKVEVPHVPEKIFNKIRDEYEKFIESSSINTPADLGGIASGIADIFQGANRELPAIGRGENVGVIGFPVSGHPRQHHEAPVLGKEALRQITKTLGEKAFEGEYITKCNCIYCQSCRFVQDKKNKESGEKPLEFSDAWLVEEVGTDKFIVRDKMKESNVFTVYLKPKIICSCGSNVCEHIKATLFS